jgi:hypothetical protein
MCWALRMSLLMLTAHQETPASLNASGCQVELSSPIPPPVGFLRPEAAPMRGVIHTPPWPASLPGLHLR